ncbi:MAG: hypothetical protein EAZ85_16235 [Bacteroidetes bacterium]|nr:MAG: hypothetical protein EAZ85_16235 [Bacteroidota bacterium]
MENKKENNTEDSTWFNFFVNTFSNVQSTTEGFQQVLEKLKKDQFIAWEEWNKFYEAFVTQTKDKKTEIEGQLTKIFERIAQNLNFVTKQEFEELKKRVNDLENK